jgi:U3 small nucleolar RNA-associated protein 14
MLGVESEDAEERAWIISCVKGMEKVASNARMTAEVLNEVIRQQDETKQRMDIRKVMHDTFDRVFAIV